MQLSIVFSLVACLLCDKRDICDRFQEHFLSTQHLERKTRWQELCHEVHSMQAKAAALPKALALDSKALPAWRHELLQNLERQAMAWAQVGRVSWSEVVSPFWPQLLLGNSGLVAEAEDPDLTVFQPPPRAGLDYPVFPPIPPSQQSWTADTPEDRIQNLDALSLLAHGLVMQGDGNYRCWYCEAVFSDVSKHLHPHYNVAKRHEKNRAYWKDYVSWITTKGHDLQDFAKIEGKKFKCRCGGDGPCYEIMQHFSSNKHVNMAKSWQKPSQELQARRKAMWQLACD